MVQLGGGGLHQGQGSDGVGLQHGPETRQGVVGQGRERAGPQRAGVVDDQFQVPQLMGRRHQPDDVLALGDVAGYGVQAGAGP